MSIIVMLSAILSGVLLVKKFSINKSADISTNVIENTDENKENDTEEIRDFGSDNLKIEFSNLDKMHIIQKKGDKFVFDVLIFKVFFLKNYKKLHPLKNNSELLFFINSFEYPSEIGVYYSKNNLVKYKWFYKIHN